MKKAKCIKKKNDGFTLFEIILVLAIISLLLGLGIYKMTNVVEDAEFGKAEADIKTLETNLLRFKMKAGFYPTANQGLKALVERPNSAPKPRSWSKIMKKDALFDPWGSEYQYRNPAKKSESAYDVYSLGKDGSDGTDDDIGNW